jgi:hypothetical protein
MAWREQHHDAVAFCRGGNETAISTNTNQQQPAFEPNPTCSYGFIKAGTNTQPVVGVSVVEMHELRLIENSFQQIRKDRNRGTETIFLDPDVVENIPARIERHRWGNFSSCGVGNPHLGGSV